MTLCITEYIWDVLRLILAGDLDLGGFRESANAEGIIEEVITIRGIRRWTVEIIVLRGLHRRDASPADNDGVRRFVPQFYVGGKFVFGVFIQFISGHISV